MLDDIKRNIDTFKKFSKQHTTRTTFMPALKQLTSEEKTTIQKTLSCLRAEIFRGKYRITGEPYHRHPMEVAAVFMYLDEYDFYTIHLALQHDTIEVKHPNWNFTRLRELYGRRFAKDVRLLSKLPLIYFKGNRKLRINEYMQRLLSAPEVVIRVKLADAFVNMLTITDQRISIEMRRRKLHEVRSFYLALAMKFNFLYEELSHLVEELELDLLTNS